MPGIRSTILFLLAVLCLVLPTVASADTEANDSSYLAATPGEHHFGFVTINSAPVETRITVLNRGPNVMNDLSVSLHGGSVYTLVDGCKGGSLSTGEQCYLTVRFAPTELLTSVGKLTINAEEYEYRTRERHQVSRDVFFSGTGATGSLYPIVPVFETRRNGDRKQTQQVYVQNRSAAFTAQVLSTDIIGDDAFSIAADHCSGQTLDPLSKCSMAVTFSPPGPGVYHAELQIDNTGIDTPLRVPLTATVLKGPIAVVDPGKHDFGVVAIGHESSVEKMTVTNTGDQPLVIRRLLAPEHSLAQFPISSDTCTGSTLAPDDSCHLMISFIPDQPGHAAATYYLLTNADDEVSQITVRGTTSGLHTPSTPTPIPGADTPSSGSRDRSADADPMTTPIIPDEQTGRSVITGLQCRPHILAHPDQARLRFRLITSGPVTFQVLSLHTTGKRITVKRALPEMEAGKHLIRLTKLFPKLRKYASGSYRILAAASGSTATTNFVLPY